MRGTVNTESDLIKAIKVSGNSGFKEFCRIYYEPLFHFLWRKTRNEQTAMDLVQELFLNVWKNRENLDESRSIKAYLYRSANNLAINHLEKKSLKQTYFVENVATEEQIPGTDNKRNFQEYVEDCFASISEEQRIVFILNKFEGLKYAEIAETLNISIKTVESRMNKTLKILREKLKPLLSVLLFFFFSQVGQVFCGDEL